MERLSNPNLSHLTPHRQAEIAMLVNRNAIQKEHLNDPSYVDAIDDELATSDHEIGHEVVARRLNAEVFSVSIIREGRTKGVTWTRARSYSDMMAISAGGESVEAFTGQNDHRGAGSDRGKAWYLAEVLSSRYVSPGELFSSARSKANQIVSSYGLGAIREKAVSLFMQKKIVYS